MDLGSLATIGGMIATIIKFVSFLKYVSARQWAAVKTQAIAWGSGIGGVWLFAASGYFGAIPVSEHQSVHSLDTAGKFILGLAIGSAGSLLYDGKKALDNSDSAAEPVLGGATPPPAA